MCTSRRLDRRIKQFSIFFHLNRAVSNRRPGLRLQNTRRLTVTNAGPVGLGACLGGAALAHRLSFVSSHAIKHLFGEKAKVVRSEDILQANALYDFR